MHIILHLVFAIKSASIPHAPAHLQATKKGWQSAATYKTSPTEGIGIGRSLPVISYEVAVTKNITDSHVKVSTEQSVGQL